MPAPTIQLRNTRSGVTLVELLIVIAILAMVTATAIPLMFTAVEGRRVREASRLVSSYFSAAKSRAIETGRPTGVMVQRSPNRLAISQNLSYVDVQPPYAGDLASSVAAVSYVAASAPNPAYWTITNFPFDSAWQSQGIKVGDTVRFNYQGRTFRIVPDANNTTNVTTLPITLVATDGQPVPPTAPGAAPFQIFRQPVRSSASPLQLPEGVVIDMVNSGFGQLATMPTVLGQTSGQGLVALSGASSLVPVTETNPVIVTFNPTGSIDYVWIGGQVTRASTAVHLMVGRSEGVADITPTSVDPKNPRNIDDMNNVWVSVGNQTGIVSTTENANSTQKDATNTITLGYRAFAVQAQTMGGK